MGNIKKYLPVLLLLFAISCRKDKDRNPSDLSLQQVKAFYETAPLKFTVNWDAASEVKTDSRHYWIVSFPGRPTFAGAAQGYRKLLFDRDSTGKMRERILEIIPDPAYLHLHHGADTKSFTGHIFIYDSGYRLTNGKIYHNGGKVGIIHPQPPANNTIKTLYAQPVAISTSCEWVDGNYIDSEGEPAIYTYQICDNQIYTDDIGGNDASGDPYGGGGGSGGTENTAPAVTAILPGSSGNGIDIRAYLNCFSTLPDAGATETVTVYVVEPQPGLPFNMGTNSVGHTAIGLSKTVNGQTITQTVGFYPTTAKLAATGSPSKIVDNTNLPYTVSITYNVLPFEFNAIVNRLSNVPATYNLYTYNCTNFVYDACEAGGIILPNPNGNVGLMQTGMTPAALGASIRVVAPDMKTNLNGGVVGQSHGPCY